MGKRRPGSRGDNRIKRRLREPGRAESEVDRQRHVELRPPHANFIGYLTRDGRQPPRRFSKRRYLVRILHDARALDDVLRRDELET